MNKLKKWLWKGITVFMFALCLMLFNSGSVQAAEYYDLPFTAKYDIGNECFIFDFTLETEDDLYLAYYHGPSITRSNALASAVYTQDKTVSLTMGEYAYVYLWVVDAENNVVADANLKFGDTILPYSNGIILYNTFFGWHCNYIYNESIGSNVEFINGDDLSDFDFEATTVSNGKFSVSLPEDVSQMEVRVRKDGATGLTTYSLGTNGRTEMTVDYGPYISETGEYQFVFWVEGEGVRSRNQYLEVYAYERPETQIKEVTNVKWSEEEAGKLIFEGGGDDNLIYGYTVTLERSSDGEKFSNYSGVTSHKDHNLSADGESYVFDFSNYMTQEGYVYRVKVRAISNDIEAYAHSEYVYSDVYDPSGTSEDVEIALEDILEELGIDSIEDASAESLQELYDNASEEEKVQIAEALKDGLDELPVNELKIAMQTSSDTLATVSAIEAMTGVDVAVSVDESVAELVDSSSVQVVGAALNAADGVEQVTLSFTDASDYTVDNYLYRKAVPLGITLNGVNNVSTELSIPVRITMQVPEGIDISKLVILHIGQDGGIEESLLKLSGYSVDEETRMVSFTVTHFSIFVFAEDASMMSSEELVSAFVERMYTVALDRDAEQGGLDYWTESLIAGENDGAGIAKGFLLSEEFVGMGYDNEEYVRTLYGTFFDRVPAEEEVAYWAGTLQNGSTREKVLSGFVNSEEFFDLCAGYGISRGVMYEDGGVINPGIGRFAERLYTKVLERAGEEAGMEYWAIAIANGDCAPEHAAKSFFNSDEYLEKQSTDEEYVKALYRTFMDRECDESGLEFWIGELSNGATRDSVLDGFAYSEEFREIIVSFGL